MKSKDLKISLLLGLCGAVLGFLIVQQQLQVANQATLELILETTSSIGMFTIINTIQPALLTFVSVFLGLKCGNKLNELKPIKWDKSGNIYSIATTIISALILVVTVF